MAEEDDERGRSPADVGPTAARLTSGIADDPDHEPGESYSDAIGDQDRDGPSSPVWGRSARTVLLAIFLVAFGTFLSVPLRSDDGLGWLLAVVGAGLALWGFATWPRARNNS